MKQLTDCNLSVHAILVLKSMDITTEEQLRDYWLEHNKSMNDAMRVQRNMGRRSKAEIEEYCVEHFKK